MALIKVEDLSREQVALSTDEVILHRGQDVPPIRVPVSGFDSDTIRVELEAYARVANPADSDTDGIDFKLGNPKAISELDMAIGASAEATDAALGSNFDAPAVWYSPIAEITFPAPVSGTAVGYSTATEDLLYRTPGGAIVRFKFGGLGGVNNYFASDVSWAAVGFNTLSTRYASGSGRFADDDELLAFMIENESVFIDRYDAGYTKVAYFNTTNLTVQVAEITERGRVAVAVPETEEVAETIGYSGSRQARNSDILQATDVNTLTNYEPPIRLASPITVPVDPASGVIIYYNIGSMRMLQITPGLATADVKVFDSSPDMWEDDTTWANVLNSKTNNLAYNSGTGVFASDEEVAAYISANMTEFLSRFNLGQTKVAYLRSSDNTLRIGDMTLTYTTVPYNGLGATNDARNMWTLQGRQRYVGIAAIPGTPTTYANEAEYASIAGANYTYTGERSSNPALPIQNATFYYNTVSEEFRYSTGGNDTVWRLANSSLLRNAIFGDEVTLYLGAWDTEAEFLADSENTSFGHVGYSLLNINVGSTKHLYYNRTDDDVRQGRIVAGTADTPQVDPEPLNIVFDGAYQNAILNYAPAAAGVIATADSFAEIKALIDPLIINGLSVDYFGNADEDTLLTRAVPWDIDFAGADTFSIKLSGFGLGPEQNVFKGTTRSDAVDDRDDYGVANPSWLAAYQAEQNLIVALRWGSDGEQELQSLGDDGIWRNISGAFIGERTVTIMSTADRQAILDSILPGTNITVDRTTDDELTISAGGGMLDEQRVQELIEATELSDLSGQVTDVQIPDDIMRDDELTAEAVRGLLDLTADEVDHLLTGASASLTATNIILTFYT